MSWLSLKDSDPRQQLPGDIEKEARRADRLEWWSLFWLATIILVMYLAMGSSQAMKSAWIEDLLSLLPPLLFLLSLRMERRAPSKRFPFGFHRFGSLAFFGAAVALAAMGTYLLYEAVMTLIKQEHPTIGAMTLFGHEVWLGWIMMAALIYSVIPPVILGRMKKKPARKLADKILYTDADMNSADWQTGLAGVVGIAGIAVGWWWADAAAAGLISLSVLKDGITNCRIALAELLDGAPRQLGSSEIDPAAERIRERLEKRNPGSTVRIRETGRHIRAVVVSDLNSKLSRQTSRELAGDDDGWRFIELSRSANDDGDGPSRQASAEA